MKPIDLSNAVILDTETTGHGSDAEIVEISIIDAVSGENLFTSLVKPSQPIPADAIAIHGITNEDVELAQPFDLLWPFIKDELRNKKVVIYNASYDVRLLCQSLIATGHSKSVDEVLKLNAVCAMDWYSVYYGHWSDYHESYTWHSLVNACAQQGIDTADLTAHRAAADCEMTRRLVNTVNAQL